MATNAELTRSFMKVAVVEGLALIALLILFIAEVIEQPVFIFGVIIVAVLGGLALFRVIMTANRRRQEFQAGGKAQVDRNASTIDGTAPGIGEGYDPMSKYRSPND